MIRGAFDTAELAAVCARARDAAVSDVAIRSPLQSITLPEHGLRLRELGVSAVVVPIFSARDGVHDRIAGKPNALVNTLVGMRACADAGLRVELEVPLLSKRIQDLRGILDLAKRAVPGLAAAQFAVPAEAPPPVLATESWDALGPRLVAALRHCGSLSIATMLPARSGIPACALAGAEDLLRLVRSVPRGSESKEDGFARGAACGPCTAQICAGIREWQLRMTSDAGLRPFSRLPAALEHPDETKQTRSTNAAFISSFTEAPPGRVLMLGSSRQAWLLKNAIQEVDQLELEAVVSPHMTDQRASTFGAPGWNEALPALEAVRPDLVIVATATSAHRELTHLCIERGHPVLVEKPVGESLEETETLVAALRSESVVMPGHNALFAPGLLDFLDLPGALTTIDRRVPQTHPGAPLSWNRAALEELMYHATVLASRQLQGAAKSVSVRYVGCEKPLKLSLVFHGPGGQVDVNYDYTSDVDELDIIRTNDGEVSRWVRSGRGIRIGRVRNGSWSMTALERSGGEHANMLRHLDSVIRAETTQRVTLSQVVEVKQSVLKVIKALEDAGASLENT